MDLLSVTQAAKQLKVTRQRVLQWIAGRRIPATRVGRGYVIRESDCRRPEAKSPGRPAKKSA